MYVLRHYTLPLALAVGLHAAAVWALYQGWHPEREIADFIKPETVIANLIVLEAKKAEPKPPPPRVQPQPQPVEESRPQPDPAQEQRVREAQEEAERRAAEEAAEQARREQERLDRLARLAELAEASLDQAIAEESQTLQEGSEAQVAQSYRMGIYQQILENWSRPPSARNGMKATLVMELIPTGEVVSVTVTESSGSTAFDRSAEQAVRRAGRFAVPEENRIFERYFRRVYLLFQPEDLLR